MRDSSPETNTGPYLVYEKFEFGIFHCPCSLLGVSDGRAISDEYRTQTVRFRSYWLPVLLTLLNWSTMVLVLRTLLKHENHFVNQSVRFQVQLEADGYFFLGSFRICNRSKQGDLVPTRKFLNLILQIRLQKRLLGFAKTRYSAHKLCRLRILTDAE